VVGTTDVTTTTPTTTPTTTTSDTSGAAVAPAIVTTASSLLAICPSNYYFCDAYYRPGCCQIGRNCVLTSCLAATASSTYISNGVTVVVPVGGSTGGSSFETAQFLTTTISPYGLGSCATGWSTCPQSLAGGCCPTGFDCGTLSCVEGSSVTGKEAPSGAIRAGRLTEGMGWVFVGVGLAAGIGMIWL
jgi:progranulin